MRIVKKPSRDRMRIFPAPREPAHIFTVVRPVRRGVLLLQQFVFPPEQRDLFLKQLFRSFLGHDSAVHKWEPKKQPSSTAPTAATKIQ
jgi:hypothetical protein